MEGITEVLAWELDPSWNIKVSSYALSARYVVLNEVQISLVEPGVFYTEIVKRAGVGATIQYSHPAYASPTLPGNVLRNHFIGKDERIGASPAKAVERIYDLSLLPNPPLRLILGKDAVEGVKKQIQSLEEDVTRYGSWSEGLNFEA